MAFAAPILPFIGPAFSAASGIFSIIRGGQEASALRAEGKQAEMAAAEEARRARQRGEAQMSTARAIAGGQGTTLEGSPLLVLSDNIKQIELDAQDLLYRGRLQKQSKYFEATQASQSGFGSAIGSFAQAGYGAYQAYRDYRASKGKTVLTG